MRTATAAARTLVETTSSPHATASRIAMQKASVSDVLSRIWPRCQQQQSIRQAEAPRSLGRGMVSALLRLASHTVSTDGTSQCGTAPRSSTRSCSWSRSRISSSAPRFGPSPPMMKCTYGKRRQISGMISTSKCVPLRQTSRIITITLTVPTGRTWHVRHECSNSERNATQRRGSALLALRVAPAQWGLL